MPCHHGDLSLGVPASFLAGSSSDQSPQHQRVHRGRQMKGCRGCLLSGADAHSVSLRNLVNTVISRGHGKWCPVYVESEQALLHTALAWLGLASVWCLLWLAAHQRSDHLSCGPLVAVMHNVSWILDEVRQQGCQDEWHWSSSFEVGTDGVTATKKSIHSPNATLYFSGTDVSSDQPLLFGCQKHAVQICLN